MTAKDHNKLVGIFLMIHGGFNLLIMLFLALIYGGFGAAIFAGAKNDEKFVGVFFIVAIIFLVIFAALVFLPQLLGGWKIFKEKPNARIWGIVGSILACISFPFGTAAGVYGLWFLFGDEGKNFYLNGGANNYLGGMNQPSQFESQNQPHVWK